MAFNRFLPAHTVQFAINGAQPVGTQIASWITYTTWDSLNIQTLTTVAATNTNVVTYSSGGDLFALNGTTAGNLKGTTAIAANSTSLLLTANSSAVFSNNWFGVTTDVFTNTKGPLWSMASGSRILKVGETFSYTAGYKVFASSTVTTPTAQAVGSGKYTIVDLAKTLSVSIGVAVAISMIAF